MLKLILIQALDCCCIFILKCLLESPQTSALPPFFTQQADLVGHNTLLKLVLRGHGAVHLAGAPFDGCYLHYVVDESQSKTQTAQDIGVLLLPRGREAYREGPDAGSQSQLQLAS